MTKPDPRLEHDRRTLARSELEVIPREPLPGQAEFAWEGRGIMLSIPEAAARLGISPASVRRLVAAGTLPSYRPTPGRVVLAEVDVAAHLERSRCEGGAVREVRLKYIRM